MKNNCLAILMVLLSCSLGACNSSQNSEIINDSSSDMKESNCEVYATEYANIKECNDLNAYQSDVSTNLPVENGVIISPYYNLKINEKDIPVYATRTANTIHSFAYLDVDVKDDNNEFNLNVEVFTKKASSVLNKKNAKVVVLPQKRNVKASINDKKITANISEFGSYSFAFNTKQDEALTIIVAKKENKKEIFNDKEVIYINPDDYSSNEKRNETLFEEANKVYYFKEGRYQIDKITVPENSVLYLEQGAYLEIIPTTSQAAIQSIGENNIVVAGRGLIDYSACCGGEVPAPYYNNKGGLIFTNVTNIDFSGITVINSQTWTLCLNDCKEIKVHDCLFFGYRVYSDGIMLSDCKNAIVYQNFVRTGDDAFETKSTTATGLTENVYFKNNDAWTDKGVAYGCIYESNHDTSDVHFEDNTVGFALGTWSNHLGCLVIQMGNRKGAKIHDITFNNIEIYASHNQAIMNIFIGGSGGRGEGYGIVKDIYFKNVTARRNYGAFLNLRTYDSENCFIYDVYVDNVRSNDVLLTSENYKTEGYITDNVVGGYNFKRLRINTLKEGE